MSRPRSVQFQIVNVRLTDHRGADAYVKAFEKVQEKRVRAKYYGDRVAMLLSFDQVQDSSDEFGNLYAGEIGSFNDFDASEQWINLETSDDATPDQVEKVREQTKALRPQFKRISFIFANDSHRFFIEGRQLSGNSTAAILRHWFEDNVIFGPGSVKTTVLPEREKVDEILNLRLKTLTLVFEPPNPDQPDDIEAEIEERMKKVKAKRLTEKLEAEEGETLAPDAELKLRAKAAADNGLVEGSGRNEENKAVHLSTVDHPLTVSTTQQKGETKHIAMVRLVLDTLKKLAPKPNRSKS